MKHHPSIPLLFLLSLLCAAYHQAQGAPPAVKKWEVFELALTAKNKYQNPYAEIPAVKQEDLVAVTFRGTAGAAKGQSLRIVGFWDGGQRWKVRFAPPAAGTWEYKSSAADAGLNNVEGCLEVEEWQPQAIAENPTRRGLVQVMEQGPGEGRYFQYADGTPFLWIGDTWWNWTKRGIHFSTYKNLVDDRAAKSYTLGQLFVAANGWGKPSSLLDTTYSVLDVAHMQKVDSMIAYANSKGITVWVHGWWSRENLDKTAGEEKIKRWWRYLVHRMGAYNVVWVIAGEYNLQNYGGLGLPFWKDVGSMIKAEDPYNRIVGAHSTPPNWSGGAEAPQWSTAEILHQEPWLDYNQTQVGHGRMANEMIPDIISASYAAQPAKPIMVTEPWYEFIEGNPTGRDVRFGAWTALLSGAAGHTYGGGHVWLANVPESPGGTGGVWPMEEGFERNTLDYEGAVSMGHLAKFFSKIEWWRMAPHPELVLEYPDPYCLALPGQEYVIYLRWGGTLKADLRAASEKDTFDYYWYDPMKGTSSKTSSLKGGAIQFLSAPGGYPGNVNFQDWVLHIRKQ
ncbi:MAG: DUF4038 domain-containing protein [Bacteroidetes bacterium]|nr:DUF4038 domain-containing protein [Bacteroidota bacterium]